MVWMGLGRGRFADLVALDVDGACIEVAYSIDFIFVSCDFVALDVVSVDDCRTWERGRLDGLGFGGWGVEDFVVVEFAVGWDLRFIGLDQSVGGAVSLGSGWKFSIMWRMSSAAMLT